MKSFKPSQIIYLFVLVLNLNLHANLIHAASKSALDIVTEVEAKNKNYISEQSHLKLVLYDSASTQIERELKVTNFEKSQDLEYYLVEFLSPKDVKGTKLLTWAHRQKTDDQWVYLSSIKTPKRIIGSNRSSNFMGSEFTYEDFTGAYIDKFNFGNLSEEESEDGLLWVFERTPKEKMSYNKQKVFISQKFMNVIKIEYYNDTGKKYKQAEFKDFKKYKVGGGKEMYRSSNITIQNLITNRKSILIWTDRQLGQKLNPEIFSKSSLK